MRMSVKKDDPGYHKKAQWRYQPFLDGKKVDHCFTADEDQGYVMVHKTDDSGKIMLKEDKSGIAVKQLFGRVELRRVKCST